MFYLVSHWQMDTVPDPTNVFGPLLIGAFFNAILYGVLLVQVYNYYQMYKEDATWIRILVIYLLVLETVNTASDIGLVYEPLSLRWGSPIALQITPKMFPSDAILTSAVQVPCQLYFASRIRSATKSIFWPLIIAFLSFVSLVGAITTTVSVSLLPQFKDFPRFQGAIITWLSSAALTDLIITVLLVWFLRGLKKGAGAGKGLGEGDVVVNKIIFLTVQTGAITATVAILDFVLTLGFPGTKVNFVFDFALAKLYSNSLLSTLNARIVWKELIDKRKNALSFIDVRKLGGSFLDLEIQRNPIPNLNFPSTNVETLMMKSPGILVRFPSETHTSSRLSPSMSPSLSPGPMRENR